MGLSDIVRAAERRINRRGVERKTAAGWAPEIQPYRGYGTAQRIHVIGRILMEDPEFDDNGDPRSQMEQMTQQAQRGYRQFFTIQVGDLPVTVHAGNQRVSTRTNQNGYFDVTVDNHGLDVGWQEVRVEAQDAEPVTAGTRAPRCFTCRRARGTPTTPW